MGDHNPAQQRLESNVDRQRRVTMLIGRVTHSLRQSHAVHSFKRGAFWVFRLKLAEPKKQFSLTPAAPSAAETQKQILITRIALAEFQVDRE